MLCYPGKTTIQGQQKALDFMMTFLCVLLPTSLSMQRLGDLGPWGGEKHQGIYAAVLHSLGWYSSPAHSPLGPGQMLFNNHNSWPERWSIGHVGMVSWWHLVVKQNISKPKMPPMAAFGLTRTWFHLFFCITAPFTRPSLKSRVF